MNNAYNLIAVVQDGIFHFLIEDLAVWHLLQFQWCWNRKCLPWTLSNSQSIHCFLDILCSHYHIYKSAARCWLAQGPGNITPHPLFWSLLTVCTISNLSFMDLLFPGSMMPFLLPHPSPTILVLHPDCLSSWNSFLFLFPLSYGKAQGKAPLNIYELSLCTLVPLDNLSLTPSRIF